MRAFANLLERLAFTPARNAKLRLLRHYLEQTPDPDRGYALAALTGDAERRARRRPLPTLLAEEDRLNAARLGGGLGYSPTRHVEVMSAILCAARSVV